MSTAINMHLLDEDLEMVLLSLSGVFDDDEPIDELNHATQCARNAQRAGAGGELIAAALFHDVARSPLVPLEYPSEPHEQAAARWLLPRFNEHIAWVVGAHVAAKLHLLSTEPAYRDELSPASTRSSTKQEVIDWDTFTSSPWWPEALELRRWDDAAKVRDLPLNAPGNFLRAIEPLRARS